MTLTLAIILNVALDLAIVAAVASVITRAAALTPHRSGAAVAGHAFSRKLRTGRFDHDRAGSELEPASY